MPVLRLPDDPPTRRAANHLPVRHTARARRSPPMVRQRPRRRHTAAAITSASSARVPTVRDNRLDVAYRRLITTNERLRQTGETGTGAEYQLWTAVERVLGRVDAPAEIDTIASRLNGKRGLLRRSLRGRDTNYAARAVVVPDPTLDLEEIGVPAVVMADLNIGTGNGEHDDVVLINRQPTLLPTNLVAVKAHSVAGSAVRIHPFLCARLAGDFDGDEVGLHRPISPLARAEAWATFAPPTRSAIPQPAGPSPKSTST